MEEGGASAGPGQPPAGWVEIDLELLEFLADYAGSRVKLDLVAFFAENRYAEDAAANIAGRIGRNLAVVRRELEDLALLGLLERRQVDGVRVYRLAPKPALRRLLDRFAATVA